MASYLFKDQLNKINLELAPTTVIANRPVAKTSLTEQQARDHGFDILVFSKTFIDLKTQLTDGKAVAKKAHFDRTIASHANAAKEFVGLH